MTHEPCPTGPEGGDLGEAWLDDPADVEPEFLAGVPRPPATDGDGDVEPADLGGKVTRAADGVRYYVANEPARLADRIAAFLMAATAGTMYAVEETTAAAVAGVAAAVFEVVARYVRNRVTPTNAKLPVDVLERVEARWRQETGR